MFDRAINTPKILRFGSRKRLQLNNRFSRPLTMKFPRPAKRDLSVNLCRERSILPQISLPGRSFHFRKAGTPPIEAASERRCLDIIASIATENLDRCLGRRRRQFAEVHHRGIANLAIGDCHFTLRNGSTGHGGGTCRKVTRGADDGADLASSKYDDGDPYEYGTAPTRLPKLIRIKRRLPSAPLQVVHTERGMLLPDIDPHRLAGRLGSVVKRGRPADGRPRQSKSA